MAIGFLKTVNKGIATQTSQTYSLAAGVEVPAGSLLIVVAHRTNAADTVASVTDNSANAGDANVYTVDEETADGSDIISVCSAYITRTIDADDIITVTWTNASAFNYFSMLMVAYTGSVTTSWADKSAEHSHFHTQAEGMASGLTAVLSQAAELVFGVIHVADVALTLSAGAGFTLRDSHTSAGPVINLGVEDKVVASTDAVEATGSWSGTGNKNCSAICVTYKEVAAGGLSILPALWRHYQKARSN